MRMSELKRKEVINVCDCRRWDLSGTWSLIHVRAR